MSEDGRKTLKNTIIAFTAIIVLGIATFRIYYYEWGGGKSPGACHCVDLIEQVQGGGKLNDTEVSEYKNCEKKYGSKIAAESACWNERNKK